MISYVVSITAGWRITKEFRDEDGAACFLPIFCSISDEHAVLASLLESIFFFLELDEWFEFHRKLRENKKYKIFGPWLV